MIPAIIFAIGTTPQYAFLILLYLFYNVNLKEIFSRAQMKKYGLLISAFLIQNFMMIIIYSYLRRQYLTFLEVLIVVELVSITHQKILIIHFTY